MAYSRHFVHHIYTAGDATAAETRDIPLFYASETADNLTLRLITTQDVTENDTDYISLEAKSTDGAGGALSSMMTAVTTKDTGGIDINARTHQTFTLTTDNLAKGSWLCMVVAKGGAGKALPYATWVVEGDFVQT